MSPPHAPSSILPDERRRVRPVVRLHKLVKRYDLVEAVRQVSLEIKPAQIYGLIGADGAGKSSLMKVVAGVLSHEEGQVEVLGRTIDSERQAEKVKSAIGFMPQGLGLNLYPTLSIEENIDFFARLRMVPPELLRERKERLLEVTRLSAFRARPAGQLSGGMKQKLGLICTLIHAPRLIILDEPTTGVDPVSRRDFWLILAQLIHTEQITALISTAYLDEASRFDHVALMHEGQIILEGPPDLLIDRADATIVQCPAEGAALAALTQAFPQHEATQGQVRLFVPLRDATQAQAQVQNALVVAGLPKVESPIVTRPHLEDLFIARLWNDAIAARSYLPPSPSANHTAHGATAALGTQAAASAGIKQKTTLGNHAGGITDGDTGWAIDAQALTRDFDQFRAVDGVSFQVGYGDIFGLLGANGAGKTTAIKMLTGILPPSAGLGRVAGSDMRHARQAIKERIGYMSQAFSLYTDLTVEENLMLFAGVYGLPRKVARERTRWAIELGELQGYEQVAAISLPMGLRQRLALGCALVHRPRVLFLDEPTSGVDPIGRKHFWSILRKLAHEDGVAILLTTHYMAEAELCDRVAMMYAGRVVADAPPAQLKQDLLDRRGQLLEITPRNALLAMQALKDAGFDQAVLHGRNIHVMSHQPEADRARIFSVLRAARQRSANVIPRPLTMEDVFIDIVLSREGQGTEAQEAA
ncbi:MAG: ATP-binding cassette domain-containing protein [Aquabacterium sp.]|jgi:ABC-2 type transport system ATP-binding protein|uniref:ATP-binding cassette domain-containing protein n=1 Tax=Aquabacterium sp. TaxID=1872578 RepID=UPI002A366D2C|nr:ATP-binding cassette domain-containing protein [Aquabacterium sp.]MDX9843487.1 ATP-binding cassette domain-containing protein [Aquabacterium sp.]